MDVLVNGRAVPLRASPGCLFEGQVDDASAGTCDLYRLDGDRARPDPVSRFQPEGVHGPSAVDGVALPWTDQRFRGHARRELVIYFVTPAIPLLFMGEEYGEAAPFPFFTSFLEPGLNEAVRRGRQREFERFGWRTLIDDPGDPTTFSRARLEHGLEHASGHRELRAYYRAWLALRRSHPALGARGKRSTRVETTLDVLTLAREAATGERVVLVANPGATAQPLPPLAPGARVVLDSADPRFGGAGGEPVRRHQALLFEVDSSQ